MNPNLKTLLAKLESFGHENDLEYKDRPKRMLNITRDTGEFLAVLVQTKNARNILEIGTSNGYSTLWLADACQHTDGHITTVELSDFKIALAKTNFTEAGLGGRITQLQGDAGIVLAETPDASVDLLFLDSERSEYSGWWPDIKRVLKKHGLLVVDNATSHEEEMRPFVEIVTHDPNFNTSLVPVGNGEFLAVKC